MGVVLLILALAARIADGIQSKQVNPTPGGLLIAGLMLLLVAGGAVLLVLAVGYHVLKGFGLIG